MVIRMAFLEMADFTKAYAVSAISRGIGTDRAGEVEIYDGIERCFHPAWDGWQVIDALKFAASDDDELRITLKQNKKLKEKVRTFYKQMHWDRFSGDRLPNQDIAQELFESSLELGVARAANCLQKGLNLLHAGRPGKTSLVEDGVLGPNTLEALKEALRLDGVSCLLNIVRILQALHYLGRMKKNPGQDAAARNWLAKLIVTRPNLQRKPSPPMGLRLED